MTVNICPRHRGRVFNRCAGRSRDPHSNLNAGADKVPGRQGSQRADTTSDRTAAKSARCAGRRGLATGSAGSQAARAGFPGGAYERGAGREGIRERHLVSGRRTEVGYPIRYVRFLPVCTCGLPIAPRMRLSGPATTTLELAFDLLPLAAVAVQLTEVVPTGNV